MIRGQQGQAAVELAVTLPVCLAVALILVNVLVYTGYCAKFDQVASDCVVAQGVSPSGDQDLMSAKSAIERKLVDSMGDGVSVAVSYRLVSESATGSLLSFSPGHVAYTCELTYVPYPLRFSVAGVSWEAPVALKHSKTVVVDAGPLALGE